jgi:hypothetical protein
MVYLNVDVNYDEDDYDEDDYVQYQHQYQLVYTDRLHCFYSNDDEYVNEKNSIKKISFHKKFGFQIRVVHDHVCNEQTNEEILLISKMCRELKEKIRNRRFI